MQKLPKITSYSYIIYLKIIKILKIGYSLGCKDGIFIFIPMATLLKSVM